MTVALTIDNGGAASVQTARIQIKEPKKDPWVERTPARDEKPEDNQFFARDDKNEGALFYNGALKEAADSVFLKVYADDQLYKEESKKLPPDRTYAFSAKLKAGLVKYKVEFGSKRDRPRTGPPYRFQPRVRRRLFDRWTIECGGDRLGETDPPYTSQWIRSYGSMAGDPQGARSKKWGNAVCRSRNGGKLQIGYWGLELARRLVENDKFRSASSMGPSAAAVSTSTSAIRRITRMRPRSTVGYYGAFSRPD